MSGMSDMGRSAVSSAFDSAPAGLVIDCCMSAIVMSVSFIPFQNDTLCMLRTRCMLCSGSVGGVGL